MFQNTHTYTHIHTHTHTQTHTQHIHTIGTNIHAHTTHTCTHTHTHACKHICMDVHTHTQICPWKKPNFLTPAWFLQTFSDSLGFLDMAAESAAWSFPEAFRDSRPPSVGDMPTSLSAWWSSSISRLVLVPIAPKRKNQLSWHLGCSLPLCIKVNEQHNSQTNSFIQDESFPSHERL